MKSKRRRKSSRVHNLKQSEKKLRCRLLELRDKRKGTGSAQFLLTFADIQEQTQQRTIEHERKLQKEAIAFQVKIDQDQTKFKVEMATKL